MMESYLIPTHWGKLALHLTSQHNRANPENVTSVSIIYLTYGVMGRRELTPPLTPEIEWRAGPVVISVKEPFLSPTNCNTQESTLHLTRAVQ